MTLPNRLRSWQATREHRSNRKAPPGRKLLLELLEDRTLPSAYIVTTTADSGPGSLRDAITQVNADTSHTLYASPSNSSVDEIDFNITAASDAAGGGTGFNATTGVATITPQSHLPFVSNAVLINGYTEAGASPNTLSQGDNTFLKIQLNLSAMPAGYSGLNVAADNITIRGLVFNGLTVDIPAIGVSGNGDQIQGCFIGTDVTGTVVTGNASWGIQLFGSNAVVGGTSPDARNIVSGNGESSSVEGGILDQGTGDSVQGNYIGTDVTGTKGLGNGSSGPGNAGVQLSTNNATVGGTASGAGNLISGNQTGINAYTQAVAGFAYTIQGNLIGTDVTGTLALGNGTGIKLGTYSLVGGTSAAARNIISGNTSVGIFAAYAPNALIQGNYIGTDVTGTKAVAGEGDGIYLLTDGETVGGTAPGAGNVISGSSNGGASAGIRGFGSNEVIQGNLIGTDYTGTKVIGNTIGVNFQDGGNNNTIGGLVPGARNVISGNGTGINLSYYGPIPMTGNVVEGNYIGTDITGTTTTGSGGGRLGNGTGVVLRDGASNNTIGGTTASARNIISGNNDGIYIGPNGGGDNVGPFPSGNVVEGNYIGLDVMGTYGLGNFNGVFLAGTVNNTISGNVISASHVVDGVTGYGIFFGSGNPAAPNSGNIVQGNRIGTDASGTTTIGTDSKPLGNAVGVLVDSNELIGGTTPGAANVIAGSSGDGVFVGGSAEHNAPGNGNPILGNSIHDNAGLGIHLAGGNNNQTAPALTSAVASAGGTTISGTLTSVANTTFRIEFFSNVTPNVSGFGEGRTYLGFATVTTNSSGNATFTATGLASVPAGQATSRRRRRT